MIGKFTFAVFFAACLTAAVGQADAAGSGSRSQSESPAKSASTSLTVTDWVAFGSGCRLSKAKNGSGNVQIGKLNSNTDEIRLILGTLKLSIKDRPEGLTECAVRLSLMPAAGTRVKHVAAAAALTATKNSAFHMRSNILLLVGDTMAAKQTWDLQPAEFARNRHQDFFLSAGSAAEEVLRAGGCNTPQIIGLDLTFEGKKSDHKAGEGGDGKVELSLSRSQDFPNSDVVFRITSEPCKG
ncbi:MAG: hypothetical protein EBR09_14400 [Proteobacteria bacterium]|nr:hypothetical protein [Pseudomonadota bacterium]